MKEEGRNKRGRRGGEEGKKKDGGGKKREREERHFSMLDRGGTESRLSLCGMAFHSQLDNAMEK